MLLFCAFPSDDIAILLIHCFLASVFYAFSSFLAILRINLSHTHAITHRTYCLIIGWLASLRITLELFISLLFLMLRPNLSSYCLIAVLFVSYVLEFTQPGATEFSILHTHTRARVCILKFYSMHEEIVALFKMCSNSVWRFIRCYIK